MDGGNGSPEQTPPGGENPRGLAGRPESEGGVSPDNATSPEEQEARETTARRRRSSIRQALAAYILLKRSDARAHQQANKLLVEAQANSRRIISEAEAEVKRRLADAEARARQSLGEAQTRGAVAESQARVQSERELGRARAEAQHTIAEAEARARATVAEAQAEAQRVVAEARAEAARTPREGGGAGSTTTPSAPTGEVKPLRDPAEEIAKLLDSAQAVASATRHHEVAIPLTWRLGTMIDTAPIPVVGGLKSTANDIVQGLRFMLPPFDWFVYKPISWIANNGINDTLAATSGGRSYLEARRDRKTFERAYEKVWKEAQERPSLVKIAGG